MESLQFNLFIRLPHYCHRTIIIITLSLNEASQELCNVPKYNQKRTEWARAQKFTSEFMVMTL